MSELLSEENPFIAEARARLDTNKNPVIKDDEQQYDSLSGENPYIAAAMERNAARAASVYGASLTNPDKEAEKRRQASALGVPVGVLPSNPDGLIARNELESNMENSPALKTSMENPDFAKVAYDDSRNLSQTENFVRSLSRAGGFLADTGSAAVSGLRRSSTALYGIPQAVYDTTSDLTSWAIGDDNQFSRASQTLAGMRKAGAERAQAEMPKSETNLGAGYYSGIASAASNLAALPLLFFPGGQSAALGMMVTPVAGESYGEAKDKGLPTMRAINYAALQTTTEYLTEKIAVGTLFKDLKTGSPFYKTLLNQLAVEIPGEQAATLLGDLTSWIYLNPEKTLKEFIAERPDAAAQTLVATIVGTGGQISAIKGVEKTVGYFSNRAERAQKAEQDAKILEQISKSAAESKLNPRDPVAYQEFLKTVDDSTEIYISGKELFQSGAVEQLSELSPSIAAQYKNAYETGGDVIIPVAEFIAKIGGSEYGQGLIQSIRVGDPNAMSLADAQDNTQNGSEELKTEVDRVLGKESTSDAFQQSRDVVEKIIFDEFNSAGRNTKAVNAKVAFVAAERVAVKAHKEGVTPEEYYKKHSLTVVDGRVKPAGKKPAIDKTFSQGSTDENYELPARQGDDILARTNLAHLRREATKIEDPKGGITFRVDGNKAIVTGPKGIKVPDRFKRFADEYGLSLAVQRREPFSGKYTIRLSEGKTKEVSAGTTAEKVMPDEYRESGALYFGEMGNLLDRTGKAYFQTQTKARNTALKKDILEVGDIPDDTKITISKTINGKIATKLVSANKAVLSAAQRDEKLNLLKGCL